MGLDGLGADEELLGDALVAHALGEQLEDLAFAVGEVVEQHRRLAWASRSRATCASRRVSVAGSIETSPSAAAFAARQDLLGGLALAEEAGRAGLDRLHQQAILVVRGDDRDLRRGRDLLMRVASIPDIPPWNTMSINTTSGRCSAESSIAVSGSWTGSDELERVVEARRRSPASVRTLWSSQISSVVTTGPPFTPPQESGR